MTAHTVRRLLAVVALVALLGAAACNDDSDKGKSSKGPATPAPQEPTDESPSEDPSDDLTSLPLSENAPNPTTPPLWAFPVAIDGWEWSTRDDNGLNQLQRKDGDVLFTSYQLKEDDSLGNDDESDSRSWLEKYVAEMSGKSEVVDVGTPTYDTVELPSDQGSIEFVSQDVTYETAAGTTYKSRFVARSIGRYMMAVQYAAPVDEWTEKEWQELIDSGLKVTLVH